MIGLTNLEYCKLACELAPNCKAIQYSSSATCRILPSVADDSTQSIKLFGETYTELGDCPKGKFL